MLGPVSFHCYMPLHYVTVYDSLLMEENMGGHGGYMIVEAVYHCPTCRGGYRG